MWRAYIDGERLVVGPCLSAGQDGGPYVCLLEIWVPRRPYHLKINQQGEKETFSHRITRASSFLTHMRGSQKISAFWNLMWSEEFDSTVGAVHEHFNTVKIRVPRAEHQKTKFGRKIGFSQCTSRISLPSGIKRFPWIQNTQMPLNWFVKWTVSYSFFFCS